MNASLALQYVVIALAVMVSAVVVMQKQWPNAARRLRIALALPLLRAGRPAMLQMIGRGIAPAARVEAGTCGGCNGCGSDDNPPTKPAG
ncbi:MAG: hypothetical protein LH470_08140 [Lysobacter sp.]|nr:hypothetical protein [Lysobacter sp.]